MVRLVAKRQEKLNPQQAAFVREYLVCGIGRTAAIAAGYSRRSADSIASDLLKLPKVQRALGKVTGKVMAEAESTAAEVVQELRRVAMSDPAELVDPATGCLRPLHEIPEHARRAIASFEVEELEGEEGARQGRLVKVKLWPKVQANEVLARKHKLLVERHEHELGGRTLTALLALAVGAAAPAAGGTGP